MKEKLSQNKLIHWLILCVQGAAVGAGAILPGVSGGVLCVAFGIYEPMMALLSHPARAFKKYYAMFIPFLIGWAAGFFLLAGVVASFFETSSSAALALFSGLVFGTLPELMKKSEESDHKCGWSAFVIPMAILFVALSVFSKGATGTITPSIFWYLFCGAIWGLSIVVPGLSSSTILIYMGLYQPMAAGIAQFDFSVLIPLLLGIAATALLSAKLVNHLLETKYALMSRIILGIIIPPTLMILPTSFEGPLAVVTAVVCFAGGFAVARLMDVAGKKLGKDSGGK